MQSLEEEEAVEACVEATSTCQQSQVIVEGDSVEFVQVRLEVQLALLVDLLLVEGRVRLVRLQLHLHLFGDF